MVCTGWCYEETEVRGPDTHTFARYSLQDVGGVPANVLVQVVPRCEPLKGNT